MSQSATPATQNDRTTCLETFEKDMFSSFPHASKSTFFDDFFLEPENLQPQNRCFVRGFRPFSAHVRKCHACHRICTLSPLDAALPMIYKKHATGHVWKCCACHKKWQWTRPKCCACHENCNTFSENVTKVLHLPRKTIFNTLRNTSECPEVPRLPRETKQRHVWNLQKWPPLQNFPSARPYGDRADGCERLRTVAIVNATSSEHTLNPQTPRVKREPLLRIRESSENDDFTNRNADLLLSWDWSLSILPSGKRLHSYWKWPIEIVDLPLKNSDFPVRFVNVYQRVMLLNILTDHKFGEFTELGCPIFS